MAKRTYNWYRFFDNHDTGIITYIPLVMIDNLYSRLTYLAGVWQFDIRGDTPTEIPMHRATRTWKNRVRQKLGRPLPHLR